MKTVWFPPVGLFLAVALLGAGSAGCTREIRKARHLSRGNKDFAAERYDRAEIEYQAVLQFPPADAHALTKLGMICSEQGRWLNGVLYLNRAVQVDPENSEARVKLGLAGLVFQDFAAAREQALHVLGREPQNTDALLLLAGSISTTQDLARAEQIFDAIPEASRKRAGYHLARGALYLRQNDLVSAEAEYRREVESSPKSSQGYEALGKILVARQELKEAEDALRRAAELAPWHSGSRIAYADFKVATGAPEQALESVRELVKKAPDYLPGWYFLARMAAAQGKADQSGEYLKRILARDPVNFDALSFQGSLLLAKNDGTNAAAIFERILKIYPPGTPQTHYDLALAYTVSGELNKAVGSVNQALARQSNYPDAALLLANLKLRQGDGSGASRLLKELSAQQPGLAQARLNLASAYIAQGDYEEAAGVYQGMLETFTNRAELPYNLGNVRLAQNKTNEARVAFERALAIAPDFLPAIEQIVELDLKENRDDSAAKRADELIQKYSNVPQVYVLKGRSHMHSAERLLAQELQNRPAGTELQLSDVPGAAKDVKEAESALLKAIELGPKSPVAPRLLASLYRQCNRQQEALQQLQSLLTRTNDVEAMLEVAFIHEAETNYLAARAVYQKVLQTNPDEVRALNNLAFLQAEHFREYQQANQLAEKARRLLPTNPGIADTLGWVQFRLGHYTQALVLLSEAAAKLPDSPEVQYHAGMANYMLGKEEPAATALKRAVQKDFSGRSEAGSALQILAIDPQAPKDGEETRLKERLERVPGDPVALQRLAAIQESAGKLPEALGNYERALGALTNNAHLCLKLANLCQQVPGESEKALTMAKRAHSLAPDEPYACALLGKLVFQEGTDCAWANSLLQQATRLLTNDCQVLYDLAWARYSVGNVTEATNAMQSALTTGGPCAIAEAAREFLGMTINGDKLPGDSLAMEARNILATNSDYAPALMVCARTFESRGEFDHAAQFYERVRARFPLFAPATHRLALVCFALGRDNRAYELALKAYESSAPDPELATALGILCYRRGNYGQCAEYLTAAPPRAGGDGERLCYLGLAQYKLQQRAESKTNLERALALALPLPLAEDARRVLTELK